MQRYSRSQSRQCQKHIKHQRENCSQEWYSTKSLLEYIRQSNENQRRTRIRLDSYRKGCREDDESSQYRHHGINHPYTQCCFSQTCFFTKIRSISRKTSHPQAHREKCLPHGSQEYTCIYLTKVRLQKEFQSLTCIRKSDRTSSQYQNQDKQHRHQNLRRFFNSVFYPFHNDIMRQEKKGQTPKNRTYRILREVLEYSHKVFRSLISKAIGNRSYNILQSPTSNHRIITQNQQTCQYTQISNPFPLSPRRQYAKSTARTSLCTTSHRKLSYHDRHTHQKHTSQINQNKSRSSMISCLVWETPNIT